MELQKIYSNDNTILTAFAESRIGGRPENQDYYGWAETRLGYLVTVCDGMGGGPGGKTASAIAVREIIDSISAANEGEDEIANIIVKAIRRANLSIIETANEKTHLKGMGSTATVLLINEHSALIAHVGDSRVYQLRGRRKIFRTFDHSMVFDMVAHGLITEEQARLSADSNVIMRALGIRQDVEVDIEEVTYNKGDRFMLCTDGIHGTMSEKELLKKVGRRGKIGVIVDDLATSIDNLGRETGGGHDNLTLAMIEMNINSELRPKMTLLKKVIIFLFTLIACVSICLIGIKLID